MSYILVKVLPNYIPVSSDGASHYCDLEFILYKCETQPPAGEISVCQEPEARGLWQAEERGICREEKGRSIHQGPRIVISAQAAPQGSIKSGGALCFAADIPASGYAYAEPEGWDCSHTCDADLASISFLFRPPADKVSAFHAEAIKVKSFLTTAQAGVCALQVRTENFSRFLPDVQDCTYTITLCKKYGLNILSFEANGMNGRFFLNRNLPVTFRWNMVCDTDTDFILLEDDCIDLRAQGFSGEKKLEQRGKGDHTYTLKMMLPEGDKTKSIIIRDTKWRKSEEAGSIAPDFSKQGYLLEYQNALYMFSGGRAYRSALGRDFALAEWELFGKYDGDIIFPADVEPVICGGKLYLIGGKKKDSRRLFYAVCDLTAQSCSFQELEAGQEYAGTAIETAAACDTVSGQSPWMVFAYEMDQSGYIVFCVYDEERKSFPAQYFLEAEGVSSFAAGIRNDILYVALATEDGIVIRKMKKGGADFADGGRIETVPRWMRWIRGNNNMFLLTDTGLYQGDDWKNTEEQRPFWGEEGCPWCGAYGGRIVCLSASGEESGKAAVWVTDIL
ncbi:MAG: hypothetical protein NC341_06515 [Blautia sp.]|nr:hypothetical protein [Blautia sp.]MCM1200981.1 hypothetical protein [Bacteroides fragilis]